ncbi:hypothetical protein [Polyangium jinanense]|uniref:Uncharacterized protein n=1 Tax=Polyangium jinanense TaxID=2829994 RepID=A0A9X4B0U2_9BACT|nr:hypothetical protein [Polyangium jinanense]MDC3961791.1 hypothetical protein [Polyangium jinanense]MDC3988315.1 hypothetical protein [Polyangium jinanense]MDC3989512.1 hypothetical protein [Polyangium jinanense]
MRKIALPGPVASAFVTLITLTVVPGMARADEPAKAGWDGRFVVGMSALGVSAVSLGFGILSTYQVYEVNEAIRTSAFAARFTDAQNVCVAAETSADVGAGVMRETCARGNTYNTLQYVMYGLHVGSALAGIYLVATSGRAGERKGVAVVPVVSAGFGGVVVRGAF